MLELDVTGNPNNNNNTGDQSVRTLTPEALNTRLFQDLCFRTAGVGVFQDALSHHAVVHKL